MHHLLPLVKFSVYVSWSLDLGLAGDFPTSSTHYFSVAFGPLSPDRKRGVDDDSRSEAEHEPSVSENSALKHYVNAASPLHNKYLASLSALHKRRRLRPENEVSSKVRLLSRQFV